MSGFLTVLGILGGIAGFLGIIVFFGSLIEGAIHPEEWVLGWFSPAGRAARRYQRDLDVRTAYYIGLGVHPHTAENMARHEKDDEGKAALRALREAGL